MFFSPFSEVNSCPWNVPDFNARKPSPLMHYLCTTVAILAMSALPEKLNCEQEWPALGTREYFSFSKLLGNWDFDIRNSITSWKRAVNFKSEETAGFSTYPHKTEILRHSLPPWSHLSSWDLIIDDLFDLMVYTMIYLFELFMKSASYTTNVLIHSKIIVK